MKRVFFVLIMLVIVWLVIPKKQNPYPRQTLVVAGSPLTIVSWNPRDRALTTLLIPETAAAEGTHGYGTYTFDAFWRLGQIDKKDGTVLSESVSEALGIPITGYIGAKNGTIENSVFTFSHMLTYLRGGFRTNVPFWLFAQFVWRIQVAKPARSDVYDFTQTPTLIADDVTIADGSQQLTINPTRVDNRLAHMFEDEAVRRETVTTAVYNTTAMPSLGNRVARLLSNLGVSVVSVGNDTPEVDTCVLSGTRETLLRASAKVVESVLGCSAKEVAESERADLTIRIGKSYAKRFLPN